LVIYIVAHGAVNVNPNHRIAKVSTVVEKNGYVTNAPVHAHPSAHAPHAPFVSERLTNTTEYSFIGMILAIPIASAHHLDCSMSNSMHDM